MENEKKKRLYACSVCGKEGHFKAMCPSVPHYCLKCGKEGHEWRSCEDEIPPPIVQKHITIGGEKYEWSEIAQMIKEHREMKKKLDEICTMLQHP